MVQLIEVKEDNYLKVESGIGIEVWNIQEEMKEVIFLIFEALSYFLLRIICVFFGVVAEESMSLFYVFEFKYYHFL